MFKSKLLSSCLFPALLVAPLPVFAQTEGAAATGICGQPAILTQNLPETLAPDFTETTLVTRSQRSEPTYVEFEVAEETEMTLQTVGRGIDTTLSLFNADGSLITWDDDGAGDLDAQIGTTLQPGSYCAQIRLLSGEPLNNSMVILLASPGLPPDPMAAENERIAAACADPNQTPVLAEGIAGGAMQETSGMVDAGIGSQSYRIGVASPVSLRIDAGSNEIDTLLTVRDASGALLFENDDHEQMPGTDSRIESTFEPGDYCVTVAPYSGGGGSFTLSVSAEGSAMPEVDQGIRIPEAGDGAAIEELGLLESPLESKTLDRAQTLWVAFEAGAAGPVTVEGISVTSAFTLRLFTESGELLEEMDSSGSLASAQFSAEVEAGRYLVGLTNTDMTDGLKMRQIKLRTE